MISLFTLPMGSRAVGLSPLYFHSPTNALKSDASLLHRALHAPMLPVDFQQGTVADFAIVRVRVQKKKRFSQIMQSVCAQCVHVKMRICCVTCTRTVHDEFVLIAHAGLQVSGVDMLLIDVAHVDHLPVRERARDLHSIPDEILSYQQQVYVIYVNDTHDSK